MGCSLGFFWLDSVVLIVDFIVFWGGFGRELFVLLLLFLEVGRVEEKKDGRDCIGF